MPLVLKRYSQNPILSPIKNDKWKTKSVFKNPLKIITKTKKPLLEPQMDYEIKGQVDNVTFPSGAVIVGDKLHVYYGGADRVCCLAS